MPSIVKLLRDLADSYEREEKGESDAELREEIASLKEAISAKPKAEVEEALEEITDEELEIIRQHRAGNKPPPVVEEKQPPVEEEKKKRPGRKSGQPYAWGVDDAGNVERYDIPRIYTGPDEAAEVELPTDAEEFAA